MHFSFDEKLKPSLDTPDKKMARWIAYGFLITSLFYMALAFIYLVTNDTRLFAMPDLTGFTATLAGVGLALFAYFNIDRADEIANEKVKGALKEMDMALQKKESALKKEIDEHVAILSEATQNALYGMSYLHMSGATSINEIKSSKDVNQAKRRFENGEIDKQLILQAKCNFEEALRKYPQLHDGYALLGDLSIAIGDDLLAEHYYDEAITKDRRQYYYYLNKARFLMLFEHRKKEAETLVRHALNLDADNTVYAIECVPKYNLLKDDPTIHSIISAHLAGKSKD